MDRSRPSRHCVQREDSVTADVEAYEAHAASSGASRSFPEEHSEVGVEVPASTAAEEHRRVCGCELCSQRDNAEVHVWSCGVLQESADRVCIQYVERASIEHRRSGVQRNHEGLSAQLAQPGHPGMIRGDG